jgi:hypothetical protein
MITIAVGIVLAVLFLCALPFLLIGLGFALVWTFALGWAPTLVAGLYLTVQAYPELQDPTGPICLIVGGPWTLAVAQLWWTGRVEEIRRSARLDLKATSR